MGFYKDRVVPRITNVTLNNRECARIRERVTAGLDGEVLEAGFGRPIDRLITQAGFRMTRLENFYFPGPRPFGYTYEGVAAKA